MSGRQIPLVDLQIQNQQVADNVNRGMAAVMRSGAFIDGPDVTSFEQEYAAFIGVAHCVGVANGTDALELALRAAGAPAGSEVILPTNSFIATAEAVVRAGCKPVLVDSDPVYHLIDPHAAAAAVGPRTFGIVGVDLYGQVAPFESLENLGLPVLEDAAQSHGATRNGRAAGTFGIAAATSFYPGKNLGAYGDAGAVTTRDPNIALTVRSLRSHGGIRKYEHRIAGMNSRLDTIQAVVLRAKLQRLAAWNDERRTAAEWYRQALMGIDAIRLPETLGGNVHAWHLFVVEVPERDLVLARLHSNGIGAGIHYPVPIHLTEAFGYLSFGPGDFPVAEAAAARILSLPLFPGITESQQEKVVEQLVSAVAD